ncbi:alpha/beta hydrolase family protein [Flavobacterium qiangtangense]|uniref:Alpha/beta hydrolase family protein n=1 Tax=Flavobacterium qiangtangense TaxID=1442595 RepID=A0ABW1PK67_9FLAO
MKNWHKNIRAGLFSLLFGLVSSSSCPVLGQDNPKKILEPKDYALWGSLEMGTMNVAGTHVSWRMRYEDGVDTLYVAEASGGHKILKLAGTSKENFIGESGFAYLTRDHMVTLIDLKDSKQAKVGPVRSYEILGDHNLLLLRSEAQDGLSDLSFISLSGTEKLALKNVRTWKSNPEKSRMALVIESGENAEGLVLRLSDLKLTKVATAAGTLELPAWDPKGRFAAFAKSGKADGADRLYLLDTATGSTTAFEGGTTGLLSGKRHIATIDATELSVREDGKAAFFLTVGAATAHKQKDSIVEIWNSADKLVYPLQRLRDAVPQYLLACWDLNTGKAFLLSDTDTPSAALTGNKDFAIVWDRLAYEPHYKFEGPSDLYLLDARTGKKSKWLSKIAADSFYPLVATDKILYKENGWKVFNPDSGAVLDCGIIAPMQPHERLEAQQTPFSDTTGKYLVLTDGTDLWKVSTSDGKKTRLTFGREKGMAYHLPQKINPDGKNYSTFFLPSFDLSQPIILQTSSVDGSSTGYSVLFPNRTVKDIAFGPLGHSNLVTDSKYRSVAYVTQSFSVPASINLLRNNKRETLFSSNPHQKAYAWGKARLVKYDVRGQEMRGILYCPDSADDQQKHPLVAHIYEIQSDKLHKTHLPSLHNGAGFNVANLVTSGYFVLLPDIRHGIGNPGKDAAESLNAVLDRVISDYPVDPARLGLVGHSFGGYETAAVIGYSSRFKAAVMGAGMSDAVSWYLSVNTNNAMPNFWRYENGQSRIGKSLFEDLDNYLENSPVLSAAKIQTPLLIWTGAEDRQVQPAQSYAMHLALRRLGKPCTMLVYPNEDHSFFGGDSSRDLTLRMQQWFDHYLKGSETDWIK